MDAMEDMDLLSGSNTHLSKLSSDGNMAASSGVIGATANNSAAGGGGAGGLAASTVPLATIKMAAANEPTIFPGIKYRNIGKTGLKCSNIGLGMH